MALIYLGMILYKYMNQKWIDLFKEQGILRIQLLKNYQNSINNRQDTNETLSKYTNDKNKRTVLRQEDLNKLPKSNVVVELNGGYIIAEPKSSFEYGVSLPSPLVFSTSTVFDKKFMGKFSTDGFFTIKDKDNFGLSLLKAIQKHHFVGIYCFDTVDYVLEKDLRVNEPVNRNFKIIRWKPGQIFNLTILGKMFGNYFCKEKMSKIDGKIINYEEEKEFRFAFLTEEPPENGYIDIYCPEALEFVEF
ncbi:MAG: hypothetical protein V1664_00450 [Candidatus Uhrbacteria bacterium]